MSRFDGKIRRLERALGGGGSGPCPHCRDARYQVWIVGRDREPAGPGDPCPVCGRPPRLIGVELVVVDRRCPKCGTVYASRGGTRPCPECG